MKTTFSLALALVLLAAAAIADAPKPPGIEDGQVTQLSDAKWIAPPIPNFPPGVIASPPAAHPPPRGPRRLRGLRKAPGRPALPAALAPRPRAGGRPLGQGPPPRGWQSEPGPGRDLLRHPGESAAQPRLRRRRRLRPLPPPHRQDRL